MSGADLSPEDRWIAEAHSENLATSRMWEMIKLLLDGRNPDGSFVGERDLLHRVKTAAAILHREDCPVELMLYAVTTSTESIMGSYIRLAVLRRADCPDEVRVACALAPMRNW